MKVIFDTDIDGDNDDVAAAAILHAFADAGQVEILAMGVVSLCPYSPACLDAINTYYGRGDIPIGVYKGSKLAMHGSSYAKVVADRCPNDIGLSSPVPEVLGVYRQVLSKQPDGKVNRDGPPPRMSLATKSIPRRVGSPNGTPRLRKSLVFIYLFFQNGANRAAACS